MADDVGWEATDSDAEAIRLVGMHAWVSVCDTGVVSGAGGYSRLSWCTRLGVPGADTVAVSDVSSFDTASTDFVAVAVCLSGVAEADVDMVI